MGSPEARIPSVALWGPRTMRTTLYQQLLDYALRAQCSYVLSEIGWSLSRHLGWSQPHQQLIIKEMPKSEVNVILEIDEVNRCQWIAVRGSSNLRNWLLNLRYTQRQCDEDDPTMLCGGLDLHRGFRAAATEVFEAILPELRSDYQIRLTGHSLGGAIAAILMLFLDERHYPVEQCVTFGQPKITDRVGARKNAHMPLIRVIHDDDIVPHLPPTTPLTILQGGYEHFGEVVSLHDSEVFANTLLQTWKPAIDRQDGFWRAVLRTLFKTDIREINENVEDHDLRHYIHSLVSTMTARHQLPASHQTLMQTFAIAPLIPERPLPSPQVA